MRRSPRSVLVVAVLFALGAAYLAPTVSAQRQNEERRVIPPQLREREPLIGFDGDRNAEDIRNALHEVLRRYPSSVAEVLRLDPTLLANPDYLGSYPALAAFLQQYPEVQRSPAYYFGTGSMRVMDVPMDPESQLRREAIGAWRNTMEMLAVVGVVSAIALALSVLIRALVSHRRWLRATKLQSDVHGKLLERLTSNQELMAYMDSPAGKQFLMAMPPADLNPGQPAAPLSRILLSVQIGMVLVAAGIGMLFVRSIVPEYLQAPVVLGVMGIAIGVGFILAAASSYILSKRLGLLDAPSPARGDLSPM
jgi:hypothetical protein